MWARFLLVLSRRSLQRLSCRHLLRHPDAAWAEVSMLPKAAQAVLEQRFVRATSSLEACQRSADGTTTKLLVRLQDGLQVEAVVMTYSHPGAPQPRRRCHWAAAALLCSC